MRQRAPRKRRHAHTRGPPTRNQNGHTPSKSNRHTHEHAEPSTHKREHATRAPGRTTHPPEQATHACRRTTHLPEQATHATKDDTPGRADDTPKPVPAKPNRVSTHHTHQASPMRQTTYQSTNRTQPGVSTTRVDHTGARMAANRPVRAETSARPERHRCETTGIPGRDHSPTRPPQRSNPEPRPKRDQVKPSETDPNQCETSETKARPGQTKA
jgi:hypothetical protein